MVLKRRSSHYKTAEVGLLPQDRESLFYLNVREIPRTKTSQRITDGYAVTH